MSLALAGGFLTFGPPGKSMFFNFKYKNVKGDNSLESEK